MTDTFTVDSPDYQPPKFVSELHTDENLFDFFFNHDLSTWQRFSVDKELSNAQVAYHQMVPSIKRVHNIFVPTLESTKYCFQIECLVNSS